MDNQYLQDLINEAKTRGGGMILNLEGKPEIVVLTIAKYNNLVESGKLQVESREEALKSIKKQKILVTGGAGYIGAHVVGELINSGHDVVILDNLSAGKKENIDERAKFYEGDLGDINFLRDVFLAEKVDVVMHFAASIEVEESVKEPVKYFENNAQNTANLLKVMDEAGVKQIIFSSTAAVYGQQTRPQQPAAASEGGQAKSLISESAAVHPNNPYGFSKLLAEKIIKYYCQYKNFSAIVFRYFNAAGCREEGDVLPTHRSHLVDNIMEAAVGKKPFIEVFGNNFPTFDGSGVRDYVHVCDIADAHILGLDHLNDENFQVFNIGTGKGSSVMEAITTACEVLNKIIPMEIRPQRPGDPAEVVADFSKIFKAWGFAPQQSSLENILKSAYNQKIKTSNTQIADR